VHTTRVSPGRKSAFVFGFRLAWLSLSDSCEVKVVVSNLPSVVLRLLLHLQYKSVGEV